MTVCPVCGRVRIQPGMRMRRMEGDRTLREETWAKLFDDGSGGAVVYLKCPECEKKAPAQAGQ